MPSGVGRQRKQRLARLGLDHWGCPESPAGHLPALVHQLAGAGAGTPPVPTVPHRGLWGSIFPGSAPAPSRPGTRVSDGSSSRGNTTGGGQLTEEGPFRDTGALLHVAATGHPQRDGDPSQPGGVTTDPPGSWPLCGQALLGPEHPRRWSRGAEAQPAGGSWDRGNRQGSPIFTAAGGPCWTSG